MSTRVQIEAILEGMEMQSDEMHSYLHRPSGRVVTLTNEELSAAETGNDDFVEPEALEEARQMLEAEDDYVELPDRFEIDEYRMMTRFAHSLPPADQDAALRALDGRGAFRFFKDTVHRLGVADAWYAFRDESYREVARDWCEANGIAYDPPRPGAEGPAV